MRPMIFVLLFAMAACGSCGGTDGPAGGGEPILKSDYKGFLSLRITCLFPEFDESTKIDVAVDRYGRMEFASATMQYEGESTMAGSRLRRAGTLKIRPQGHAAFCNDRLCFEVDENTDVEETIQQWAGDVQVVNETRNSHWSDGLMFYLDEAEAGGAVMQIDLATGSATWTLGLVPAI